VSRASAVGVERAFVPSRVDVNVTRALNDPAKWTMIHTVLHRARMRIGNSEIGNGLNGVDALPPADSWMLEQSYQDLYQNLLRQGCDVDTALEIVRDARTALSDVYHSTMVNTGADSDAARRAVQAKLGAVMQLARLLPKVRGDIAASTDERGRALKEALDIVRSSDLGRVKALYPWLNQTIKEDAVLRAAGLDVAAIRKAGGDQDLKNLLGLLRTALDLFIKTKAPEETAVNTSAMVDLDRAAATTRRIRAVASADPTSPFGAFALPRRF
jgi:hypothetical protein